MNPIDNRFVEDHDKKEALFIENMKLVPFIMHKHNLYCIPHYDKDDITQTGYLGLWKACCSYDKNKGIKFSTYATRAILNQILLTKRLQSSISRTKYSDDIDINSDNVEYMFEYVGCELDEYAEYFDKFISDKRLTDTQKEIIKLAIDGKSEREIGDAVGLSQVCVCRRLYKIKKFIIDEYGYYKNWN